MAAGCVVSYVNLQRLHTEKGCYCEILIRTLSGVELLLILATTAYLRRCYYSIAVSSKRLSASE
jgi:hypothetical protein